MQAYLSCEFTPGPLSELYLSVGVRTGYQDRELFVNVAGPRLHQRGLRVSPIYWVESEDTALMYIQDDEQWPVTKAGVNRQRESSPPHLVTLQYGTILPCPQS